MNIDLCWQAIPPCFALDRMVAVNPLQGFEDLSFEEALERAGRFFEQSQLPEKMEEVNRESIKWCSVLLDRGQAQIRPPVQSDNFYAAWRALVRFEGKIKELPHSAEEAIEQSQTELPPAAWEAYATALLVSLPGWAAYVKFLAKWNYEEKRPQLLPEFLAMRILLAKCCGVDPAALISWLHSTEHSNQAKSYAKQVEECEKRFRVPLLDELIQRPHAHYTKPNAQLIFCIDVRSERFRRALEAQGSYETFGFAGFFGVPCTVMQANSQLQVAACPVLLQPQHTVLEHKSTSKISSFLRQLYQSAKYSMTAPLALVDLLAPLFVIRMLRRNFLPGLWGEKKPDFSEVDITQIALNDQVEYAFSLLKTIGLSKQFADSVILCGHGSQTENNAFKAALDCGACGGNGGFANAKVMASILNSPSVRDQLAKRGVLIPKKTTFYAAFHDTTTDGLTIHKAAADLDQLCKDAKKAQLVCCKERGLASPKRRARDWAEVRPEWGLAGNGAFIVGPRSWSSQLNLEGRCFLHSYDWEADEEGTALRAILTAPMVVAQWINSQYLFSTLNNTAYGAGSKVTKNVTGKLGVMQGNASDLMHGLPLQSVLLGDTKRYHEPVRLLTAIFAPKDRVAAIVESETILRKLVGNGWVTLCCFDPQSGKSYQMKRSLTKKDGSNWYYFKPI